MDKENEREQPKAEENAKNDVEKEEVATCPQQDGSQLGKFKDVESLLSAYNSLQAEFTRKCQKLSQTIKDLEDKKDETTVDAKSEENIPDNISTISNQNPQNCDDVCCSETESVTFKSPNWNQRVCEFLKNNSLASNYKTEISQEILADKDLQKSKNCLDLAWARVMEKEFKPVKTIINDENFIRDQILSNEQIKKIIIEKYVEDLSKNKPPKTINSGAGIGSFSSAKKPNNLNEAKDMVAEMFNIKGV